MYNFVFKFESVFENMGETGCTFSHRQVSLSLSLSILTAFFQVNLG